jgi:DNA-binding response OmpR family regulator
MDQTETEPLRGTHILVVEDESILALDLALLIEDEGASVAGPLFRLEQAMAFDDLRKLDAALLDVDLAGREVFPLADRLRESNVPIVFHTARTDVSRLRASYPEARIVRKPSAAQQILRALARAVSAIDAPEMRTPQAAAS